MFAGVYVCICVLGCEIWVCLFRVFFPSIMVQPECSVCEGIVPLGGSVYSTVENERLQERKGQEGPSHTSLHVKLEEKGVQPSTSRLLFYHSLPNVNVTFRKNTYLSVNIC